MAKQDPANVDKVLNKYTKAVIIRWLRDSGLLFYASLNEGDLKRTELTMAYEASDQRCRKLIEKLHSCPSGYSNLRLGILESIDACWADMDSLSAQLYPGSNRPKLRDAFHQKLSELASAQDDDSEVDNEGRILVQIRVGDPIKEDGKGYRTLR